MGYALILKHAAMKNSKYFTLPGLCLLSLTFLIPAPASAQQPDCCSIAQAEGLKAFNKNDYATAIRHWTDGKKCPDKDRCPDLDDLIKKARAEMKKLAEAQAANDAYDNTKTANTKAAYQAFLNKYPNSQHAADARKRLKALEDIDKQQPAPTTTPLTLAVVAKPNLILVRGGTFRMGCTSEQKDCDDDEKPVTSVNVSDFYLGKYEVTVREFQQFIKATGYKTDAEKDGGSYFWTGSAWEKKSGVNWKCDTKGNVRPISEYSHPVIHVSWNDAVAYCNWLSEKEGLTKVYTISGGTVTANWNANGYRLPTEAEWEYAARGGGKAVLLGNGKNIADPSEINFYSQESAKKPYSIVGNYRGKTVPVGSLNSPNALGLHDMSGNVWEWCWDWYGPYPSGNRYLYRGKDSGSHHVFRGGAWSSYPQRVRVTDRSFGKPSFRGHDVGFRLARGAA